MFANYIFSKYFTTNLAISLLIYLATLFTNSALVQPLFFSLFFVNTITLHLFLHDKKLSQFFELPKENSTFSFNFFFYIIGLFLFNLFIDHFYIESIYIESTFSLANFLSQVFLISLFIMLIPIVSIDISSFAILKNKLNFKEQLSLFNSKNKLKTLFLSSLVFSFLSLFINQFLLINFIITYSFFTYFVPSKHFQEVYSK